MKVQALVLSAVAVVAAGTAIASFNSDANTSGGTAKTVATTDCSLVSETVTIQLSKGVAIGGDCTTTRGVVVTGSIKGAGKTYTADSSGGAIAEGTTLASDAINGSALVSLATAAVGSGT